MTRRFLPFLLAFLILVPTLDAQSIWWDEGISLHLADLPWRAILNDRAANIHPPLYFMLLKAWTGLVGSSIFAGRYLSALATVLTVAVASRFVARRFGRRAGQASALLVAMAPPMIVYGQEIRAYALLTPLTLALLAWVWPPDTGSTAGAGTWTRSDRWRRGLSLALIQAAMVLLHYAGGIAVALAQMVIIARWLWARLHAHSHRYLRDLGDTWLIGGGMTLACLLPWALYVVLTGFTGMSEQAGLANVLAEAVPAGYVVRLLALFHLFGMPEALEAAWLGRTALIAGVLLGVAIGWVMVQRPGRHKGPFALLLLAWGLPFLSVPLIWSLSPQAHPRYLFPFVIGGWLVAGVTVTLRVIPTILRLAVMASLLAVSVLGLQAYLLNPRFTRSDVRGVAAFVRTRAVPGDIVIVPHTDWSLEQYDLGHAQAVMVPPAAQDADVTSVVQQYAVAGQTIYALDYRRGALDPRGDVRAALTWGGVLTERHAFQGVLLEVYEMASGAVLPPCVDRKPLCVAGGDLCLTGVAFLSTPVSGAALPVHLCWRGKGTNRYAAVLGLAAPGGALVSQKNDLLLNQGRQPTDLWSGNGVDTYHVVPLPVGAPPLSHTLTLGVYDVLHPDATVVWRGDGLSPQPAVDLGILEPAAAPWLETSSYSAPPGPTTPLIEVVAALQLESATLDRAQLFPGQAVFVTARWRVTGPISAALRPRLILRQDGRALAAVESRVAWLDLPVGRPIAETLPLVAPPEVAAGLAEVVLTVGDQVIVVGDVAVEGGEHQFTPPPVTYASGARAGDIATLVGFDLAPGPEVGADTLSVEAGAPLTATLVWRAGPAATAANLKVFVHLVSASGEIVAQHDAVPAAWTRPTTGWVPGEIVVDAHPLTWQTDAVDGPAYLRIGFYDPETGERLLWASGDDALVLPVALTIQ